MTSVAGLLREQLHAPDGTGRDLALLRTRAYRFSNDLRWYILAEALEEQCLAGKQPNPSTMDTVRACLASIREDGSLQAFPDATAVAEDVDIEADLDQRTPHSWQRFISGVRPTRIVVIIGAPRSGTSHLFNLLAATGKFAYFTTASCWAWPVRNLRQSGRRLFTTHNESTILTVDNKKTRIIPGLVMPGEAEDIWHRAMPVYRHIRGHHYDIGRQPEEGNPGILDAAASAHLAHFNRDVLLVKSPFNSFRIPKLERHWGSKVTYVHIIRDQRETADSMRRNRFEFTANGRLLDAEDAWAFFVGAAEDSAPADRTVTIRHADMLRDPNRTIGALVHRLS
jgi:Sulfotransferase family